MISSKVRRFTLIPYPHPPLFSPSPSCSTSLSPSPSPSRLLFEPMPRCLKRAPSGPERSRSLETQHRDGPFRLSNHLRCAAIAVVQAVRSFVQRSRQLQTGRQGSPECKMPDIRVAATRHRMPQPTTCAVGTRPESFSSAIFRSRGHQ